jgi:agmatine/peptidylarginine deiminase
MPSARLLSRSFRLFTGALLASTSFAFHSWNSAATSAAELIATKNTGFGPAVGVSTTGRMLGEFEHQDALLLGVNELLQYHPETLCEILTAVGDRIAVIGLISDPAQEQQALDVLSAKGISTKGIRFFFWPAVSMWVQDFGPICVVGDDEVRIVDFSYHFADRKIEDQTPLAFAATYGMKLAPERLTMEGGNLLSNGRGLCVSSTTLIEQNKARGYDLQAVGSVLQSDFRFKQWTYLPPLVGEPTGHVDMFVTLTSPSSAIVGMCDPKVDAQNAAQLDGVAKAISKVIVEGAAVQVTRIPMPPHDDGKWRTYTNVIYANGVVLVPQYPDVCPELDREALDVYRQALPEWKVVGINASTLIEKRGSLHCLSRCVPVLNLAEENQ